METTNKERLLINATQPDIEVRFAIINGKGELENAYIEQPDSWKKNNVYKGVVKRIEPSLQAAFVDFGSARHGFLPFKEIARNCYKNPHISGDRHGIADLLEEGQEIMVQVDKEERGNKGAALTTFITLAGSYLVLMPNNPSAGGISRRIEGEERDELRDLLNSLQLPYEEMGLIIRTAGLGKSQAELQWDLDILLRLWEAIHEAYRGRSAPFLIHQESDIITRAIRDYLRQDIEEILIDSPEVFEKAKKHIEQIRPEFSDKIHLYESPVPLFSRFKIERQIESAFLNELRLPSGGSIVIQQTEALVSIDVNSSRDTKGGHIEQTAFNTNREAAIEVARQLRLRDIGGLIVVDFIDMMSIDNQREVVEIFEREIRVDRARVQYGRISKFGLLEISRQRLRPSLVESSQTTCPRCDGQGTIRNIESIALFILRIIHEEALQENLNELILQLPVNVATFLLNEKRSTIMDIEKQNGITLRLIPNPYIEIPDYKVERIREDAAGTSTGKRASYKFLQKPEAEAHTKRETRHKVEAVEPAVRISDIPQRPSFSDKKSGVLGKIWSSLFGAQKSPTTAAGHTERESTRDGEQRPRKRTRRNAPRQRTQTGTKRGGRGSQSKSSDEIQSNHPPHQRDDGHHEKVRKPAVEKRTHEHHQPREQHPAVSEQSVQEQIVQGQTAQEVKMTFDTEQEKVTIAMAPVQKESLPMVIESTTAPASAPVSRDAPVESAEKNYNIQEPQPQGSAETEPGSETEKPRRRGTRGSGNQRHNRQHRHYRRSSSKEAETGSETEQQDSTEER